MNTETHYSTPLSVVIAGHVDHGKSTLVGRLMQAMGRITAQKEEEIRAQCARRGMPFEWAFVMDALQEERNQGITIDTSHTWLSSTKRSYVLIDAPGHKEFLRNMITGAAGADAALLVIDVREGAREQSRRHGYMLHLLGIRQVAVVVGKMDAVQYEERHFREVEKEFGDYLCAIGLAPTAFVPVSARDGEGVCDSSKHMSWYAGPSLVDALDALAAPSEDADKPLRFAVQDIYKFDDRRIIAGRVESGAMKAGDELLFSPSCARAKIANIEAWPQGTAPQKAQAGMSVGVTLDEPIFVQRGQVASHADNAPMLSDRFRARIFWLAHEPMQKQRRYKLRLGALDVMAELRDIEYVVDPDTLAQTPATDISRNMIAEVLLRTRGPVPLDAFAALTKTGRFVIMQGYDIAGGGIVHLEGIADQRVAPNEAKAHNITPVASAVTAQQRAIMNGHLGGVLWLTGLSGAGKSTLAQELQRHLFQKGCHVFVLDGDNLRGGLCRDLGFSPEDRHENLRRAGEVAALFAQSGTIVITAFISPTEEDRKIARSAAPDSFHLVHVQASLEVCEQRDVKGLYKRARAGEIAQFTGISAPYEAPRDADLVLDTAQMDIENCVAQLQRYVERQFIDPIKSLGLAHASDAEEFLSTQV